MINKCILVTGSGGNVAQGVIRNLKDSYPHFKIISTDIAKESAINYLTHKHYIVPYAVDETYIPTIASICTNEKVDLIIPTTDYEVYYLAKNKQQLPAKVICSSSETTGVYLDKYKTFIHHQKHEIPFSKTVLAKDYKNQWDDIIAKPKEGRGSRGILINPKNISNLSEDYIIQPLHKGIEITSAVYITKENKIHGIISMQRELTNGTTTSCKVNNKYDSKILEIISKMILHADFIGSINLQSIVDSQGNIHPFEVNCRISGTNSIRHHLGFRDVIYLVQEHLLESSLEPTNIDSNGYAHRILTDVIYNSNNSKPILH